MSFSNSGGGTLTLPSPTHVHHVDVSSAVRSLRRSLSRSPSKFSLVRTNSQSSESSQNSHSPSPQSPCRRYTPSHPQPFEASTTPAGSPAPPPTNTPSFFSTPFRPSVKLSLRSAKSAKTASTPSSRPFSRLRTSPKSPLKRALSISSDSGNSANSSSASTEAVGQENNHISTPVPLSPLPRRNFEKPSRHSLHLDVSGSTHQAIFKAFEEAADALSGTPASGALKRSDAIMNLDQANFGSPVAKRRSLHGISSLGQNEADFNIFDHPPPTSQNFEIHEDSNNEYELTGSNSATRREPLPSPTPVSTLPRRSTSLRKTTLQQRQSDRGSWGRRTGAQHLAQMGGDFATPAKNRPRLSMDQFLPPQIARDSPFSSSGPLPSASIHQIDRQPNQPHPLSKTLTPSSSGNSLSEEIPLHFAASIPQKSRVPVNFSKSLPYGSLPPFPDSNEGSSITVSTPKHKSLKLWEGAFMTTGLVSKMNRNPEQEADKKMVMPDTPCKRHNNSFATYPPPPSSAMKKNNRNSFGGIPTTPFNPTVAQSRGTFGNPAKGLGIFQRLTSRHTRRGSVLSLDGEDKKLTGETNGDMGGGIDGDVPPTPTKQTPSTNKSTPLIIESPSAVRRTHVPTSAVRAAISRESTGEYTRLTEMSQGVDSSNEASQAIFDSAVSPSCDESPSIRLSFSSFSRSRAMRGFNAPSPLRTQAIPTPLLLKDSDAKIISIKSVSPVPLDSPRTPQESMLPPDPSRLTISNLSGGVGQSSGDGKHMPPPVTPTTGRDTSRHESNGFVTPVNARHNIELDACLHARFSKVEPVGEGEFSSVYRVVEPAHKTLSLSTIFTPGKQSPSVTGSDKVFAVKKCRQQFLGLRDRELKFREVGILQELTHAKHVLHYEDHWEWNHHLYIQTEYCEEGNLEGFLSKVGRTGRLDDFRIWKILHDLCLVSTQSIYFQTPFYGNSHSP
jgi:mitosis inhibitor protein kinase SWE1